MMSKCYFLKKKEKKKGSYFCWCCIINMENIWELFIDMDIEYIGEYCLFLIECLTSSSVYIRFDFTIIIDF